MCIDTTYNNFIRRIIIINDNNKNFVVKQSDARRLKTNDFDTFDKTNVIIRSRGEGWGGGRGQGNQ